MSEEIEPFVPEDEVEALEPREFELLSRLHQISLWLALHPRTKVLKLTREEYAIGAPEAEVWIRKAEDFLALGVPEAADRARQLYNFRLQRIHDTAMAMAVRDSVEVIEKPTRLIVERPDGGGGPTEVVRKVTHTKVKHQILDTGALQVALKAARELAHLAGLRVKEGRGGGPPVSVNVQVNNGELPSAQQTSQLANQQLAAMLGAEVVAEQDAQGHVAVLPERVPHQPGPADDRVEAPAATEDASDAS